MNSPLFDGLNKYLSNGYTSFHMPGHGGRSEVLSLFGEALKYDLTELDGTGNLFEEEGDIPKSEALMAKLYGSRKVLYSTAGCTLPIQTMLRLALKKGDKLLCGRNAHKSVINTLALIGALPIWMSGDGDNMPLFGRISPTDVEQNLQADDKIKAVFVTSPDYYGVISDVKGISEVCRKYNVPLLVDAAHGSHLRFCDPSLDPISCGASMAAYSAHKTLPVLTGGAMLHIADQKYLTAARDSMRLFCSTSPSYLIMLSLDICLKWLMTDGEKEYTRLAAQCGRIKAIAEKQGFIFPSGLSDPCRLTFITTKKGISGYQFGEQLKKHGIEPEFCDECSAVLIPAHFADKNDFDLLEKAVVNSANGSHSFERVTLPLLSQEISPIEVINLDTERVSTENAVGRIAAEAVTVCPPCIPLVSYGEKISSDAVKYLKKYSILDVLVVK